MWVRFIVIFGLLGLAEYYSFILMRSTVRSLSPALKTTTTILYALLTLVAYSGIFFIRQLSRTHNQHMLFNLYFTIVLGMIVGKLLVTALMLVDDIRRILVWLFSIITSGNAATGAQGGVKRSEFIKTTAVVLAGLSLLGFGYGIRNRYNYRIRRIKLSLANLPAAFKGFKLVQISDIHTGSFDSHVAVEKGIKKIMDERPDLILFTGDLVNNTADEVDEKYKAIFSTLKAPMGVFSTLGNHDYGEYVAWNSDAEKRQNLEDLKATHAQMGWRLLMNEHVLLKRGDASIALIGIENWSDKARFPKYGNMVKATAGLSAEIAPVKILMSHDPSHWNAQVVPEYPYVDLTLSGHTHGMQFGVDSKWLKWSPVQYMYKQWAGLYQEGDQYLYVNRGFGFIGYPGRLGILPEITVIELV